MSTNTVTSPSVTPRTRPLERLEAEIVELASQLTAATARLLSMIGEFDEAEGWRDWGMRSTAHWLSWKCGIGLTAGREQVRVARALRDLPTMSKAFAEGRLSYSKVRGLTRFATPSTEEDLAVMAEYSTASQITALGGGARKARAAADVRERHRARFVSYHHDDDGSLVGRFRLPPEQAAVFVKGLDAACGRVPEPVVEGDPDTTDPVERRERSTARTNADALVLMAEAVIDNASAEGSPAAAERFQLVIHTPLEALQRDDDTDDQQELAGAELATGERLHPATARRLTCDCPATTMVDGLDGSAVHVGRRTRRVKGGLLRAVNARDRGRCRAPGCTERATQIHHLRHWANGGSTCLGNLISLCNAHHWLVHDGGWTVVARSPGRWALLGPAGVVVDRPTPVQPATPLPYDDAIAPHAVAGLWEGGRFPLNNVVDWLEQMNAKDASAEASRADVSRRSTC